MSGSLCIGTSLRGLKKGLFTRCKTGKQTEDKLAEETIRAPF